MRPVRVLWMIGWAPLAGARGYRPDGETMQLRTRWGEFRIFMAFFRGVNAHVLAASLSGALLMGTSAIAGELEIEEPEISKGEVELEYRGGWSTGHPASIPMAEGDGEDDDENKPGELENEVVRQVHEVELEIGLTDWLQFQAGAEFEQERDDAGGGFDSLKLSEIELTALLELVSVERHAIGATLLLGLEETLAEGQDQTTFVIGPIVKAVSGPLSATGNFYFAHAFDIREREIEDGETEETRTPDHWTFSYASQIRYQAGQWFGFGAEAFGEVTDIGGDVANSMLGHDPRSHRIGPALYFTFGGEDAESNSDAEAPAAAEEDAPSLETALALLFGLTDDDSNLTFKWDVQFEF